VQGLDNKVVLCVGAVLGLGLAPVSSSIQDPALGQWLAQAAACVSPTTASPTIVSPTIVSPTTVSPTTVSPTTVSPTTVSTCGAPQGQGTPPAATSQPAAPPNGGGGSAPAPSPATD